MIKEEPERSTTANKLANRFIMRMMMLLIMMMMTELIGTKPKVALITMMMLMITLVINH